MATQLQYGVKLAVYPEGIQAISRWSRSAPPVADPVRLYLFCARGGELAVFKQESFDRAAIRQCIEGLRPYSLGCGLAKANRIANEAIRR